MGVLFRPFPPPKKKETVCVWHFLSIFVVFMQQRRQTSPRRGYYARRVSCNVVRSFEGCLLFVG